MEKISGVNIAVKVDDIELTVEDDGYIGNIPSGIQVFVQVEVKPGADIYGFDVDGTKNVKLKKDWAPYFLENCDGRLYSMQVHTKRSEDGFACTWYPQNHMRLLELDRSTGGFKIWEIALISQGGDFFLTTQQTYEARCFRKEDKVVCPRFEAWTQLVAFLGELFAENAENLAPVSEYEPERELNAEQFLPSQGRVLWWNSAQGVGAIITPEGAARVHWTQVSGRPRLSYLVKGEVVKYEELVAPRQTNPNRQTRFQKEVRVVTPL